MPPLGPMPTVMCQEALGLMPKLSIVTLALFVPGVVPPSILLQRRKTRPLLRSSSGWLWSSAGCEVTPARWAKNRYRARAQGYQTVSQDGA